MRFLTTTLMFSRCVYTNTTMRAQFNQGYPDYFTVSDKRRLLPPDSPLYHPPPPLIAPLTPFDTLSHPCQILRTLIHFYQHIITTVIITIRPLWQTSSRPATSSL